MENEIWEQNGNINMIRINTLEIAGFAGALKALRLPFGREMKSNIETYNIPDNSRLEASYLWESNTKIDIDKKDLALMQTLIKRGDEHAKVMRGIIVWAEITAPIYWWCEEETYRAGHERLCSESTMHIDCQGLSGEELQNAKAEIPMGKQLTKIDFFSYQCLRNIYKQRRNHRLKEWHQFCGWIETLPYAKELIIGERK